MAIASVCTLPCGAAQITQQPTLTTTTRCRAVAAAQGDHAAGQDTPSNYCGRPWTWPGGHGEAKMPFTSHPACAPLTPNAREHKYMSHKPACATGQSESGCHTHLSGGCACRTGSKTGGDASSTCTTVVPGLAQSCRVCSPRQITPGVRPSQEPGGTVWSGRTSRRGVHNSGANTSQAQGVCWLTGSHIDTLGQTSLNMTNGSARSQSACTVPVGG